MTISALSSGKRSLPRLRPDTLLGSIILVILAFTYLFPGVITSASPFTIDVTKSLLPPSWAHPFGTDEVGRDVFARVVHGTRITLSICAGSLAISMLLGGVAGVIAGYYGWIADALSSRVVDVMLSFPPIILGVIITGVLGPSTTNLVLALAIVYTPTFFRIARAGAIAEAGKTYVEAARSVGLSEGTIVRNHLVRNVAPLMISQFVILFPMVLQMQAALGFLGLGVQPPDPDWGAILEEGKDYILKAPWMSIFPGLTILITSLALLLCGRALQRRIDSV
jgi:peptide/nickel transport system permease protein